MQQFMRTFFQHTCFVHGNQCRILFRSLYDRRFIRFVHSIGSFFFDRAVAKWLSGTPDSSLWTCHHFYKVQFFFALLQFFNQFFQFFIWPVHRNDNINHVFSLPFLSSKVTIQDQCMEINESSCLHVRGFDFHTFRS